MLLMIIINLDSQCWWLKEVHLDIKYIFLTESAHCIIWNLKTMNFYMKNGTAQYTIFLINMMLAVFCILAGILCFNRQKSNPTRQPPNRYIHK